MTKDLVYSILPFAGVQSIFSVQSFKVEPDPAKIGKPVSITAGVSSGD